MTYICEHFQNIRHNREDVDDIDDAAGIFAGRMARRDYGRSGLVAHCNREGWSEDFTSVHYSAFVGFTGEPGQISFCGHNVHFTVVQAVT